MMQRNAVTAVLARQKPAGIPGPATIPSVGDSVKFLNSVRKRFIAAMAGS